LAQLVVHVMAYPVAVPAGGYVARLDSGRQGRLRDLCKQMLPAAPFVVAARAWAARSLAN
jgi:hypothetical protein